MQSHMTHSHPVALQLDLSAERLEDTIQHPPLGGQVLMPHRVHCVCSHLALQRSSEEGTIVPASQGRLFTEAAPDTGHTAQRGQGSGIGPPNCRATYLPAPWMLALTMNERIQLKSCSGWHPRPVDSRGRSKTLSSQLWTLLIP